MSFKQALKMKLPFTRKGLEDYLDERFSRMEEKLRAQTDTLISNFADELYFQFHTRSDTPEVETGMPEQRRIPETAEEVRQELWTMEEAAAWKPFF